MQIDNFKYVMKINKPGELSSKDENKKNVEFHHLTIASNSFTGCI